MAITPGCCYRRRVRGLRAFLCPLLADFVFQDHAYRTVAPKGGLRLGAQEMTRYGMLPQDFAALAKLLAAILRDAVAALRSEFTQMHYWFD